MHSKRINIILNIIIILSFVIFSILGNIFLLKTHTLLGAWDLGFHLKRINELMLAFNHHQFLNNLFAFNYFHGSAVLSLYPYVTLFPVILLSIFVKSQIDLIYIYFIFITFVSLVISYYSCLHFSSNKNTSFLFAIMYNLSNVVFGYTYFNMDVGMILALAFFPLCMFGTFNIISGKDSYLELALGITFIVYSHVISTILIIFLLLIFILINIYKLSYNSYIRFLKAILLSLLLSSIVWINMIFIMFTNKIKSPNLIHLQSVPSSAFFTSAVGGTNPVGLGTWAIVAILLSLLFWKKFTTLIKQCYVISLLIIIICSKLFPWSKLPYPVMYLLSHFQDTFRFLVIPIILLDYVLSIIFTQYIRRKKLVKYILCLVCLFTLSIRIMGQERFIHHMLSLPKYSYNINYNGPNYKVTNNIQLMNLMNHQNNTDYYPSNISERNYLYINHYKGKYNKNKFIYFTHKGYNSFYFRNKRNINNLQLPILYYKHENLRLYLDNKPIHYKINKSNIINISAVKRGHHILSVKNVSNGWLSFVQMTLNLAGIVWMIFIFIRKKGLK